MCYRHGTISFNRDCPSCGAMQCNEQVYCTECGEWMPYESVPATDAEQVALFFQQIDDEDVTNAEKVQQNQRILRRVEETSKDKSVETVDPAECQVENGLVIVNDRLIGLGIHIFNEDIYPLQSFEIYLRGCQLHGNLNLSNCTDMMFLDVYNNQISTIRSKNMPKMRIFGVQGNCLESIDLADMPALQGVDAGRNRLTSVDVSNNPELVELYVNNNQLTCVDTSANPKLKYFYCHGNGISELDMTANPELRHLNCTDNPLTRVKAFAPQSQGQLPLELSAGEGGYVGLTFKPIYNAQWKETGEWEQTYSATPQDGWTFEGWFDQSGVLANDQVEWRVKYGSSHVLAARFVRA